MKQFLNKFLLAGLLLTSCNPALAQNIEGKYGRDTDQVQNYVHDGNGDNYVAGLSSSFITYQDSSGTRPTDGTGGTTTGISAVSKSTTTPIKGKASLVFTKDAANRQGGGWSVPFTIDNADKAKIVRVDVKNQVISGTFVAGTNTTDSDVILYIFDVTNSRLIEPMRIKFLESSTTAVEEFTTYFQASADSTSYRLIYHIASTSALAYSLRSEIQVGPNKYNYGPVGSDLIAYTPTLNSTTGVASRSFFYEQVNGSFHIEGAIVFNGTGAAGILTISLPAGYSIDTNRISTTSTAGFDHAWWYDNGVSYKSAAVHYASSTTLQITVTGTGSALDSSSVGNGDVVTVNFTVPVVGKGALSQTSDQNDMRNVQATYVVSSGASTTLNTPINFDTKISDTHGAVTTGAGTWKFTATTPGSYKFFGSIAATGAPNLRIYKNGTAQRYLVAVPAGGPIVSYATEIDMIAGDYADLRFDSTQTPTGGSLGTYQSVINVSRSPGASSISPVETVSIRYVSTAGTAIGTGMANFPFPTKVWDSHGASYNTSTGIFTCPIMGRYSAKVRVVTAAVTHSTSQAVALQLFKNAAAYSEIGYLAGNGNNAAQRVFGADTFDCIVGDQIEIRAQSAVATTGNTGAGTNYLAIERIGN